MKPLNSRARPKAHKTAGQALVEFSLILPILLFVVFGIIDFGRILMMFSGASGSIRNATRQATLVGQVVDTQNGGADIDRFRACGIMYQEASAFLFSEPGTGEVIQFMDIFYYDTTGAARTNAEIADSLEFLTDTDPAVNPNLLPPPNPDPLSGDTGPDYDCNLGASAPAAISNWESQTVARDTINPGASIQNELSDVLSNGDIIVIVMRVEIDFITPILSDLFDNLAVIFRSQRTIVTELELSTSIYDRDGDSLPDEWEYRNFGCVLDGTEDQDEPVYILPGGELVMSFNNTVGWAYVATIADPPVAVGDAGPTSPGTSAGLTRTVATSNTSRGNCAVEDLPETLFASGNPVPDHELLPYFCDPVLNGNVYENCIIIATGLFNALDDPNSSNCVLGCQLALGTGSTPGIMPGGAVGDGDDADGDGIPDFREREAGTDPNVADTDGDGVNDGDELTLGTDPLDTDSDNDRLTDGDEVNYCENKYGTGNPCPPNDPAPDPARSDTDGDGFIDGLEIEGFDMQVTIDGVTRTETVFTLPGTNDSDQDGITDDAEVNGHQVSNAIDGTFTVITFPDNPDSDGDRLCDGPGAEPTTPVPDAATCHFDTVNGEVFQDTNPVSTDTDRDRVPDYDEVVVYGTIPDNINSDGDSCTSADGTTGLIIDDYEELWGSLTENINLAPGAITDDGDNDGIQNYIDANGDGTNNALDNTDSDGDGLSDCDEVYVFGTNPYDQDTDGDATTLIAPTAPNPDYYDIGETNNICTLPNNPDSDGDGTFDGVDGAFNPGGGPVTCDLAATTASTDGDTVPDAWERLYFGDEFLHLGDYDIDAEITSGVPYNQADGCDLLCEYRKGTNPTLADTDGDGIRDGFEVGSIATDNDSDNDGVGDGREGANPTTGVCVDAAADGAWPGNPAANGVTHDTQCWASAPRVVDSDGDGLWDSAEVGDDFLSQPTYDYLAANNTLPAGSYDGTLTYTQTNPTLADTDGDGRNDGDEVTGGVYRITVGGVPQDYCGNVYTNPRAATGADTDGDGLGDLRECYPFGTNPANRDTDGDGLWDGSRDTNGNGTLEPANNEIGEVTDSDWNGYDSDPLLPDSDGDGLTDIAEARPGVNGVNQLNISYRDADGNTQTPAAKQNLTIADVRVNDGTNTYDPDTMLLVDGDTDGDGLSDAYEINRGGGLDQTDPFVFDTDMDGLSDGVEENDGDPATDPLVHSNFSPSAPTIAVNYQSSPIAIGGTSIMRFIVTNTDAGQLTNVSFSNQLPDTAADDIEYTGTIGGTCTTTAGGSVVFGNTFGTQNDQFTVSGITLAGTPNSGDACTLDLTVQGNTLGTYASTSSIVTSDQANSAAGADATLEVSPALPTITASFNSTDFAAGNQTTLTYRLTNLSPTPLTGATFNETLPNGAGELFYTGPVTGTCLSAPYGGTDVVDNDGATDNRLTVSGMAFDASGGNDECTVIVAVSTTAVGTFTTGSSPITATTGPNGTAGASATLTTTMTPPIIQNTNFGFTAAAVNEGDTSVLGFTLENTGGVSIENVAVSIELDVDADSEVTFTGALGGTCATTAGGSAAIGDNPEVGDTISITGITLPASGTCDGTFTVNADVADTYTATSSTITSTDLYGTAVNGTDTYTSSALTVSVPPCDWIVNNGGSAVTPDSGDDDTDGFTNAYECQDGAAGSFLRYMDPTDATSANAVTAFIQAGTLRDAVTDAVNSNLAAAETALGARVQGDGRIAVIIERTSSGNTISSVVNITTICGPTTANPGGICASWSPGPNETDSQSGSGSRTVTINIAPSAILELAWQLGVENTGIFRTNGGASGTIDLP